MENVSKARNKKQGETWRVNNWKFYFQWSNDRILDVVSMKEKMKCNIVLEYNKQQEKKNSSWTFEKKKKKEIECSIDVPCQHWRYVNYSVKNSIELYSIDMDNAHHYVNINSTNSFPPAEWRKKDTKFTEWKKKTHNDIIETKSVNNDYNTSPVGHAGTLARTIKWSDKTSNANRTKWISDFFFMLSSSNGIQKRWKEWGTTVGKGEGKGKKKRRRKNL